ncbi:hypothetical protein HALLA_14960 [Halostagnicola larsenii XH-48]|uniref:Uncharacterized protein n=1 Tax=Halostagnicola larsenii XH-48 TaxID=797299 RepID=W0JUP0_9EURY|nr:hypothetical protein HALLA_14960 [Halostagnicola larsenii XH-48]
MVLETQVGNPARFRNWCQSISLLVRTETVT